MEVNKIKQYIIWKREDLNLQCPSSKPHILPLANVHDIYIILILIYVEAIQRKRIVLHIKREDLNPQPQPHKPQRLPFNQYSQCVQNCLLFYLKLYSIV